MPGTGKSQLTKVLAKEIGCELFEVSYENEDGDPVEGGGRLRALNAAQSFLSQQRALILFDEVEDVFNNGGASKPSTAQMRKGWINRTLEENQVPVFWLSNSASLDSAFIRRFDMVIELPIPPKQQRKQIVQSACGDMFDASSVSRMAEVENLSPAVISRSAAVIRCIEDTMDKSKLSSAIEHLVSNTMEAQGHRTPKYNDTNQLSDTYDLAYIHSDIDLAKVAQGLAKSKSGKLCLYGPPGTGKTAFARWLADQLDVPLLVKRGSDIISCWLGETEQNIAHAFKEAEQEKALLLIDEVDSFLQDRRNAQRSWEVSSVNELLTQMESYAGLFIASTNLMSNLDQAALRRFDLKVKFDYLKHDQASDLFFRHCKSLKLPPPTESEQRELSKLINLTPGDFATVVKQHRFYPMTKTSELVAALTGECAIKEGGNRIPIGFH
jgi:SpoVK/Ycf46/Vps4 family AAA+-type ATPase